MKIDYLTIDVEALPHRVQDVLNTTLQREGGYNDLKHDYPTKYGIRRLSADRAGYSGAIEQLTRNEAAQIWTSLFWYGTNLHLVHEVSPLIAETVMDTSGPAGSEVGNMHLQKALTSYNERSDTTGLYLYGTDLVLDGLIGPATISQLRKFVDHRGIKGTALLVMRLNCLQEAHFTDVAVRLPGKRKFSKGWSDKRVADDLLALAKMTDTLVL